MTSTRTTARTRYNIRSSIAVELSMVSDASVSAKPVEKIGCTHVPGVQQYMSEIMTVAKIRCPEMCIRDRHMEDLMKKLRKEDVKMWGSLPVKKISDYLTSVQKEDGTSTEITLPKSDVMGYTLEGGSSVVIRPSGTEPKIKIYYSLRCRNEQEAKKMFDAVTGDIHAFLNVE